MSNNRKKRKKVIPSYFDYAPNQYSFGSFMDKLTYSPTPENYDEDTGKYTSGAFSGWSKGSVGALTAAAPIAGSLAGTAISGGFSSTAGSVVDSLSNVASAIPGPWGAIAGAGLKVVGGLVNRAFGAKFNEENIREVESNIKNLNNFSSNAGSYDALTSNMLSRPAAMQFDLNFIGKNGWFNHKATRKFQKLKAALDSANAFVTNSLSNNMNNIANDQANQLAANFAELGGLLFQRNNRFDEGGKTRSSWGSLSKPIRHSWEASISVPNPNLDLNYMNELQYQLRMADIMRYENIRRALDISGQEYINRMLRNADATTGRTQNQEYINRQMMLDAATRRRMLDIQNSLRHKYADGGILSLLGNGVMSPFGNRFASGGSMNRIPGYGIDLRDDLVYINEGGRHELNPRGGVLIGTDNEGTPNLVEQGEVVIKSKKNGVPDYVISDKLNMSEDFKKKYKIKGKTYADGAKYINKESEQREMNKISKNYKDKMLNLLIQDQEKSREEKKKQDQEDAMMAQHLLNFAANGGFLFNRFSNGGSTKSNKQKDKEKRKKVKNLTEIMVDPFLINTLPFYDYPDQYDSYTPTIMVMPPSDGIEYAMGGPVKANILALGSQYTDWLKQLSDADYLTALKHIFGDDYTKHAKYKSKYLTDRDAMIAYANKGNPGDVYNGIVKAYDAMHTAGTPAEGAFNWDDASFTEWYNNNLSDADFNNMLKEEYGENSEIYNKYLNKKAEFLAYAKSNQKAGDAIKVEYGLHNSGGLSNPTLDEVTVTGQSRSWKNPYFQNGIWDKGYRDYIQRFLLDPDDENFIEFNPEGQYGYPDIYISNDPIDEEMLQRYNEGIADMLTPGGANSILSELAVALYEDYLASLEEPEEEEGPKKLPPKPWGWGEGLMFAGAAGDLALALSDRLGFTNQPDFSAADSLNRATSSLREIRPQFIGNTLKLQRPDPRIAENAMREAIGRNITANMNLGNANRGQTEANNLAALYTYLNTLGTANIAGNNALNDIQKAEYDANMNRDKFNAEQDLKAQIANGEVQRLRMNAVAQELALRDAAIAKASGMQSANAAAALQDLYKIGVHFANRNDAEWLANAGLYGTLPWLARFRTRTPYEWPDYDEGEELGPDVEDIQNEEEELVEPSLSEGTAHRRGGRLRTRRKRRRGITI